MSDEPAPRVEARDTLARDRIIDVLVMTRLADFIPPNGLPYIEEAADAILASPDALAAVRAEAGAAERERCLGIIRGFAGHYGDETEWSDGYVAGQDRMVEEASAAIRAEPGGAS